MCIIIYFYTSLLYSVIILNLLTYLLYYSLAILTAHNKSLNILKSKISYFIDYIPKLPNVRNTTLQCGLDISSIVTEVNGLLPQLADFIGQFNSLVTNSGINVITDSAGNMSIDLPQNMSDSEANYISNRIGVIDRLITNHGQNINDLLQKGLSVEDKLKGENPHYVSQLSDQISQLKKLNSSYKH